VLEQLYRPLADVPWDILHKVNRNAANSYRFRQLKSRGVLIRAQDAPRYEHFADMGWGGLFKGGLEIIDVPGDHMSLLDDTHIVGLSQALQKCLARLIKY
jgi:thioesterase domain-containing protein